MSRNRIAGEEQGTGEQGGAEQRVTRVFVHPSAVKALMLRNNDRITSLRR